MGAWVQGKASTGSGAQRHGLMHPVDEVGAGSVAPAHAPGPVTAVLDVLVEPAHHGKLSNRTWMECHDVGLPKSLVERNLRDKLRAHDVQKTMRRFWN